MLGTVGTIGTHWSLCIRYNLLTLGTFTPRTNRCHTYDVANTYLSLSSIRVHAITEHMRCEQLRLNRSSAPCMHDVLDTERTKLLATPRKRDGDKEFYKQTPFTSPEGSQTVSASWTLSNYAIDLHIRGWVRSLTITHSESLSQPFCLLRLQQAQLGVSSSTWCCPYAHAWGLSCVFVSLVV